MGNAVAGEAVRDCTPAGADTKASTLGVDPVVAASLVSRSIIQDS